MRDDKNNRKIRGILRGVRRKEAGRGGRTDYRVYHFSRKEWLRYLLTGSLLGCLAVWICYRSAAGFPAGILILVLYLSHTRKKLCRERKETLNRHFKDVLNSLHTSMMAGYSLENAVRSSARDLRSLYGPSDPMVRELADICRGLDFQQPVEVLFYDLGVRSGVDDIRSFGEVLMIAKRTGGSMKRVLEDTARSLGEKIDTKSEIHSILASKEYEQKIMSAMPAGIILYLQLAFGDFMDGLYGNALGALAMTGALAVYLAALYIAGRMLAVENLE